MKTIEERFWEKVGAHDDPGVCWIWQAGTVKSGKLCYGHFDVAGRMTLAHRFAYTILVGPIPEGLEPDHTCRNTLCVNPVHMELVTHKVNVLRGVGVAALRAKQIECIHGHPFDEGNTYLWHGNRHCRACRMENQLLRRAKDAIKV